MQSITFPVVGDFYSRDNLIKIVNNILASSANGMFELIEHEKQALQNFVDKIWQINTPGLILQRRAKPRTSEHFSWNKAVDLITNKLPKQHAAIESEDNLSNRVENTTHTVRTLAHGSDEIKYTNIEIFRRPENVELAKELLVIMFRYLDSLGIEENRNFDIDTYLDSLITQKFGDVLSDPNARFKVFKDYSLVDLMFANRRAFFTLVNWLYVGKAISIVKHPAFRDKLHHILNDRYGWAHLIGACSSLDEAWQMDKMVREIFKYNPKLNDMYSMNTILSGLRDVITLMRAPAMRNQHGYNFLGTFFRQVCNRFFEQAGKSRFIIEKGVDRDSLIKAEQAKTIPHYIASPRHEVMSLSDMPYGVLAQKGYENNLANYLEAIIYYSGHSTRNENTRFLQDISWIISHMGLPVLFDRTAPSGQTMTALDHMLNNIPGLQREKLFYADQNSQQVYSTGVDVIHPYTTGNCWDQARIMTLYLAMNGPKKTGYRVMQVGNQYADHSYLIITRLSARQIESMKQRNYGNLSMLQLFRVDPSAVLVDPWAKGLYPEPIKGLHYAEYPHNDRSKPRVPDYLQDVVTISSQADIGDVYSYQGLSAYYTNQFFEEYNNFLTNTEQTRRWTSFCLDIEKPYDISHQSLQVKRVNATAESIATLRTARTMSADENVNEVRRTVRFALA